MEKRYRVYITGASLFFDTFQKINWNISQVWLFSRKINISFESLNFSEQNETRMTLIGPSDADLLNLMSNFISKKCKNIGCPFREYAAGWKPALV